MKLTAQDSTTVGLLSTDPLSVSITVTRGEESITEPRTITFAPPLTLSGPAVLPAGRVGDAYTAQLAASGGFGLRSFELAQGSSLPLGLTLLPSGQISGTPTEGSLEPYPLDVVIKDAHGRQGTGQRPLIITPPPPPPLSVVIEGSGFTAVVGQPLNIPASATGGVAPLTLSGTQVTFNTPGTKTATVTVTDANGDTASDSVAVEVSALEISVIGHKMIVAQNSIAEVVFTANDGTGKTEVVDTSTPGNKVISWMHPSGVTASASVYVRSTAIENLPTLNLGSGEGVGGAIPNPPEAPVTSAAAAPGASWERRTISESSGSITGSWNERYMAWNESGGTAELALIEYGGGSIELSGRKWQTSDPNVQQTPERPSPPPFEELEWSGGFAGASQTVPLSGSLHRLFYSPENRPPPPQVPYDFSALEVSGTLNNVKSEVKSQVRLRRQPGTPMDEAITVTYLLLVTTQDGNTTTHQVTAHQATIFATQEYSGTIDITASPGQTKSLLPMELAPEVLAVNTNFDEGDTTESHAAKPDCANGTLKAKKDHLDGKWKKDDIVTDDLHQGFFGLRPGTLPYTETAGAVVKIKKLDKNDPETNRKQSGHVRLYAVWGSKGSESEMKIELYDKDSLVANDIGPQLYHQNPNTPVTFYLEGVEPGKITLEFSYQKGSTSFKHEQEFLVATKKTRAQWREEVVYQIRLQESSFSPPNPYSDITKIKPALGYRHPNPANDNSRLIALMYYYYAQLFDENQEKFLWPGMARVAATSIYAGMSDMYLWNTNFITGGEPGAVGFVNDFMIPGAQAIFNDLAWAHHAYAASGIYAIKHLNETESDSVDFAAWKDLDEGIAKNNMTKIRDAGGALLDREQNVVIQPYYATIGPVKFKPPGVNWLWAFWLGGVEVTRDADGKCEIGEWMSANSVHNPIPGPNPIPAGSDYGPLSFRSVVPGGRLDNAGHRWTWITHAEHGMLPRWSGTGTGAGNFTATMRLNAVRQVLHDAALIYSQTGGAGLPPW